MTELTRALEDIFKVLSLSSDNPSDQGYTAAAVLVLATATKEECLDALKSACASLEQPIDHLGRMLHMTMMSAFRCLVCFATIHERDGSAAFVSPSPSDSNALAAISAVLGKLANILDRLTPRSLLEDQRAFPEDGLRETLAAIAFKTAMLALDVFVTIGSSPATAENEGSGILDALLETVRANLSVSTLLADFTWEGSSGDHLRLAQTLGSMSKALAALWSTTRSELMLRASTYFTQFLATLFSGLTSSYAQDIIIRFLQHSNAPSILYFLENICARIISMDQSLQISPDPVLRRQCSLALKGLTFFLYVSLSIDLSSHELSKYYLDFAFKCFQPIQSFVSLLMEYDLLGHIFTDVDFRDLPSNLHTDFSFDGSILSFLNVFSLFMFYDRMSYVDGPDFAGESASRQLIASVFDPSRSFSLALVVPSILSHFWATNHVPLYVLFNILESAFPDPTSMAQYVRRYEPELMRILSEELSRPLLKRDPEELHLIDKLYVFAPYLSAPSRQQLNQILCTPASGLVPAMYFLFDPIDFLVHAESNALRDLAGPSCVLFTAARLGTLLRTLDVHKADPTMQRMLPTGNGTTSPLQLLLSMDRTILDLRAKRAKILGTIAPPPLALVDDSFWATLLHRLLRFQETYPEAFRGPTVQSSLATFVLYLGRLLRVAEREAALGAAAAAEASSEQAQAQSSKAASKRGAGGSANMSARERLQLQLAQREKEEARKQAKQAANKDQREELERLRRLQRMLHHFAGRLRAAVEVSLDSG